MELGEIIGLSLGSTSMIGTIIDLTTSHTFENKNSAYYLIFILGAALSFVPLFLSFFGNRVTLLCFIESKKRF